MPTTARQKPVEPRKRQAATPTHGSNRTALETAVGQMATGPHHAALIELCRTLADTIDRADEFDDKAFREYRMALGKLMEAAGGGVDELDLEVSELRASVRD